MLLMGKESRKNCEIVADIPKERKDSQFVVQNFHKSIIVKVNATMSVVDGKLHSLVTGLGGGFYYQ